ncbi:MAG: hypothetical protein R3F43_02865 [bacterium]
MRRLACLIALGPGLAAAQGYAPDPMPPFARQAPCAWAAMCSRASSSPRTPPSTPRIATASSSSTPA